MDAEITPEPRPDERAALGIALADLRGLRPDDASAWWRAGVREAVEDDDEGPGAPDALRP
jgi:hypothetical protein